MNEDRIEWGGGMKALIINLLSVRNLVGISMGYE